MGTRRRTYHHGGVPSAVLTATLDAIDELGPSGVGLREVARRAGVSHATVTHHFGDKSGVFTAVAADGYRLLAAELDRVRSTGGGFLDLGVGYVRFAIGHRSHFEVMFRPDLYRPDDERVVEQRRRTAAALYGGASELAGDDDVVNLETGVAGWALVHGIAQLWATGNLPPELGDDPESVTRRVARHLGPPSTGDPPVR